MAPTQLAFDLYHRGDLDGAEAQARASLKTNDDPALRHLLGVVLCRRGSVEEGSQELGRALEVAPWHVGIRVAYVRALIDCGRPAEALRNAPRPAPGPAAADLWRLRAEAADAAGALVEKVEAQRQAELESLQSGPATRPVHLRRARLLGVLRRDSEAEGIYRQLLQAAPDDVEAAHEFGLLLERSNRLDDVRAMVDHAVAAGAKRNDLALLEALLAWREGRPDDALHWLDAVDRAQELVRVQHLKAKALDALGRFDEAFAAAEAMNQAVPDRRQWRDQASGLRQRLRAFAGAISPEWASGWTPVAPGDRAPPVFLLGFPRSGTTLLDTFLMGHPRIAVLEEIPLMGLVADQVGPLDRIADIDDREADRLRRLYFDALTPHVPNGFDGVVVDKMPLNMTCAPLIHRLFPDARIIFAQRHPFDCVLSAFLQNFNMNAGMASFLDLGDSADLYDVAMNIWTRSTAVLPLHPHSLVYERLVADPERELRALIAFLGLEWEEGLVEHRGTARARGQISTASYDQVTEALTDRSVERWRNYERQLEPVRAVLSPWAELLGYAG